MTWEKYVIYIPQFEWTSENQYGSRYKKKGSKQLTVAKISCERDDVEGLQNLVLLSHTLNAPVRYNFTASPQRAYIEVVSKEKLLEVI